MVIDTQHLDTVCILKLTGELDASNAVQVDDAILEVLQTRPQQIWIDGHGISYISSAGLGVFLSHLSTFQAENINLVFYGLNAKIRNVFSILGLDPLLNVVPTQEDAEAAYVR
jgi:anti-sigma B factor antagonist